MMTCLRIQRSLPYGRRNIVQFNSLWLTFIFGALFFSTAAEASNIRILSIGESMMVESSTLGLTNEVHISNGDILRVRSLQSGVVMTAKKLGSTTVRWGNGTSNSSMQIWVLPKSQTIGARTLTKHLLSRPSLKLEYDALPQLVVVGELDKLETWQELSDLARTFEFQWLMRARIQPHLRSDVESALRRQLAARGWSGLSFDLQMDGWTALLAPEQARKTLAKERQLLGQHGVELRVSSGVVGIEPMIRTQIRVTELRRSTMRRMGIRPPQAMAIDLLPTISPTSGFAGQLQAQIEFFEDQGHAKMLAAPTLLCRSGGKANFFAGGEIPLRLVSERSAQVEWKRYGIGLEIHPIADAEGRLRIRLGTEISELDASVRTDGLPGLTTHRMNTEFNLQKAGTLVLSGLFRRDQGESRHGWPGLLDIPILGALFSSREFSRRESELVIFVSPEVINVDAPSDQPNQKQFPLLKRPEQRQSASVRYHFQTVNP